MEELKSTEILDREILEDARKKAHKILKIADDTLESQTKRWEKKVQRALTSVRKVYAERIKKNEEEILARLPLDRRRLRSETSEEFLVNAMNGFLRSLDREKLISVLERDLAELLFAAGINKEGETKFHQVSLTFSGLSLSEARRIIGNIVPSGAENWNYNEDIRGKEFPSIVINTPAFKISASIENAVRTLLSEKRSELATALLGDGVLCD